MTRASILRTSTEKGRTRPCPAVDRPDRSDVRHRQECEPITGRGVGYKLFTAGLIPSMGRNDMQRVYRLLKEAREEGIIPWDWIVDETRELERVVDLERSAELCPHASHDLSPRLLGSAARPR